MKKTNRAIVMVYPMFLLSSCIIVGETQYGASWDTGAVTAAGETDVRFMAEPNRIESHGKTNIEIIAKPNLSFVGLEHIYSMGPVEVLAFDAFEDRLALLVSTKPTAQLGTLSLIFDFGDEEVHFAEDVVRIDLSMPDAEGESDPDEMAQNGTTGQHMTAEQNSND